MTLEKSAQQTEDGGSVQKEVPKTIADTKDWLYDLPNKIPFPRHSFLEYDNGTNIFSRFKRLGIFILHEQRTPEWVEDFLNERVFKGDVDVAQYSFSEIFEMHIPFSEDFLHIGDVTQSLRRMQKYIKAQKDTGRILPEYIFGLTYLARPAKRWGFTVCDVPQDVLEQTNLFHFLQKYKDSLRYKNPKEAEKERRMQVVLKKLSEGKNTIQFCYMKTSEFLEKEW